VISGAPSSPDNAAPFGNRFKAVVRVDAAEIAEKIAKAHDFLAMRYRELGRLNAGPEQRTRWNSHVEEIQTELLRLEKRFNMTVVFLDQGFDEPYGTLGDDLCRLAAAFHRMAEFK
jgi:hypothetical protein